MADTTETKQDLSRGEFAAYLRELADEFDGEGDVRIDVGNKTVTLRPPESLSTEIETSERSSMLGSATETLEIGASWSPADSGAGEAETDPDRDAAGDSESDDGADAEVSRR